MAGKSPRRQAREAALAVLYGMDVGSQLADDAIANAIESNKLDAESEVFLRELVDGVLEKRREIDGKLESMSHDWALDRQAAIDRNVMRIAAYELLYCPGIPAAATINEAVEMVKKYSTSESGRFVNGVLGALSDALVVEPK